jgi:hypothetical protein
MTEVQRADPVARRHAVWSLVIGAIVGALLIVGFERYRLPLQDWVLSEPEEVAPRLKLLLFLCAGLLSAPLLSFAAYLWWLGSRVLRAHQYPPPGQRVIRDTPMLHGPAAVSRGWGFKILAVCLGGACVGVWVLLWRLALLLGDSAP